MLDALLLRPSLHFTIHFTQLHFTTLSFGLTSFKFPTDYTVLQEPLEQTKWWELWLLVYLSGLCVCQGRSVIILCHCRALWHKFSKWRVHDLTPLCVSGTQIQVAFCKRGLSNLNKHGFHLWILLESNLRLPLGNCAWSCQHDVQMRGIKNTTRSPSWKSERNAAAPFRVFSDIRIG
jgi:hypothetical protein